MNMDSYSPHTLSPPTKYDLICRYNFSYICNFIVISINAHNLVDSSKLFIHLTNSQVCY